MRWWREGYFSSTGRCFDIGGATRSALARFERTREPYPGDAAPDAAGNGPLMKLAPVALAFARRADSAAANAGLSARTTHGDPRAADAARHMATMLVRALGGASKEAVLDEELVPDSLHPAVDEVAGGSYKRKSPPAVRGTGFVVDALEAALLGVVRDRLV